MKLILTGTVDKSGIVGDAVEVRNGYGCNYFIPQGKAIVWPRGAEKQIEGIKRTRDAREVRGVEHAQEPRIQIEELTAKAPARAAESGSLFGVVIAANLAPVTRKADGPATDKRSVSFARPVKAVGNCVASVKLHPAVTARVGLGVVPA